MNHLLFNIILEKFKYNLTQITYLHFSDEDSLDLV
jgi:hypothetical protein